MLRRNLSQTSTIGHIENVKIMQIECTQTKVNDEYTTNTALHLSLIEKIDGYSEINLTDTKFAWVDIRRHILIKKYNSSHDLTLKIY